MLRASATLLIRTVAIAGAAVAIEFFCLAPWRSNLVMRQVHQRSVTATSADEQRAVVLARASLDDLNGVARSERLNPAWYLLYGANCEILERWPDAVNAYSRALQIDDRPEIYVNRGLVYLHMGRTDAAAADMATAARFNPNILEQLEGPLRIRVTAVAGPR
jgi:tetratricopeptide (TPR) repeat protein